MHRALLARRDPLALCGYVSMDEWRLKILAGQRRIRLADMDLDSDGDDAPLAPPAAHAVAASQMQRKAPAASLSQRKPAARPAAPMPARAPTPPPPTPPMRVDTPPARASTPPARAPTPPSSPPARVDTPPARAATPPPSPPAHAATPPPDDVDLPGGDGMFPDEPFDDAAAFAGLVSDNDDDVDDDAPLLLALKLVPPPVHKPHAKRDAAAEALRLPPPKRQSALRAEQRFQATLDERERRAAARLAREQRREERTREREERRAAASAAAIEQPPSPTLPARSPPASPTPPAVEPPVQSPAVDPPTQLTPPAAEPPAQPTPAAPRQSPSPLAAVVLPSFLPPYVASAAPSGESFAARVAETIVHESRRAGTNLSHPLPRRMQRRAEYVPFNQGIGPVPRDSKMWMYFVAACARCHQPPASLADARQRMRILGTHVAVCRPCMEAATNKIGPVAPAVLPRPSVREAPPLIYDGDAHPAFAAERVRAGLAEQVPRAALEDADCLVPYGRNIGPVGPRSPLWGYFCAECTRCAGRPDDSYYRLLGTPLVVCRDCYDDVTNRFLM